MEHPQNTYQKALFFLCFVLIFSLGIITFFQWKAAKTTAVDIGNLKMANQNAALNLNKIAEKQTELERKLQALEGPAVAEHALPEAGAEDETAAETTENTEAGATGFTFEKTKDGLLISGMDDRGSAALQGLKKGDIIVKINDEEIKEMPDDRIADFFRGVSGDSLALTFISAQDMKIRTVVLKHSDQ